MKRSNAVEILAVPGIPLVGKDDDLVALIGEGLARDGLLALEEEQARLP